MLNCLQHCVAGPPAVPFARADVSSRSRGPARQSAALAPRTARQVRQQQQGATGASRRVDRLIRSQLMRNLLD